MATAQYRLGDRRQGDTNSMLVLADVKVVPNLLENTARAIRTALAPLMEPPAAP